MSFTLTLQELREGCDRVRELPEPDSLQDRIATAGSLEARVGRGERWLDEHDEARRLFLLAATDITFWRGLEPRHRRRRDVEHTSRWLRPPRNVQTWDAPLMVGAYIWLAGERKLANEWLKKALHTLRGFCLDNPWTVAIREYEFAQIHYLLGDWKAALRPDPVVGGYAGWDWTGGLPSSLAAARLGHDVDLVATRTAIVEALRAHRVPPHGLPPSERHRQAWTDWEWLEECFVVQSLRDGSAVPAHLEMLKLSELLSDRPARGDRR